MALTKELFFASCTAGRKEETALYPSLVKLGTQSLRFFENNRAGLPHCYNQVLSERAGRNEIVVFVHDDVTISDLHIREKLQSAVCHLGFGVIGLAGTTNFRLQPENRATLWITSPKEALSGAVEQPTPGCDAYNCWSMYGPTPRRCVVVDGLFLAVDLAKIGGLRFDERFLFHFYDLDFCLTAFQAGIPLGTTNIHVNHKSLGGTNSAFFLEQGKFRAKWNPMLRGGAVNSEHLPFPLPRGSFS